MKIDKIDNYDTRVINGRTEIWVSICSAHIVSDRENCPRCDAGFWIDWEEHLASQRLYAENPEEWRRLANLPNSPQKKRLKKIFPNLKDEADDE